MAEYMITISPANFHLQLFIQFSLLVCGGLMGHGHTFFKCIQTEGSCIWTKSDTFLVHLILHTLQVS